MTTLEEAREAAARARCELGANLDAIEDRLNAPKRLAEAYRLHPIRTVGIGIGILAATAGLIAWAVAANRD